MTIFRNPFDGIVLDAPDFTEYRGSQASEIEYCIQAGDWNSALAATEAELGELRPFSADGIADEEREYLDALYPKFLYQLLASDAFFNYDNQFAKGAKMPRGDKEAIMNYPIPIPPLSEQQRIVDILDRFDALVNDLSAGLPAEIEARRKQYEYYRDTLLTFKRKAE